MHYGVWLLIFLRKEQMQMKLIYVKLHINKVMFSHTL